MSQAPHLDPTKPILVIGATGKTGQRVVSRLRALDRPVRAGSRRSADTPFDWEDASTWAPALRGVGAAYITYFPDLAFPGASDKIRALAETAAREGVGRLVLLSGRGEAHAQECEEIIRTSGLDFTLVRASWFAQNFTEGYLRDPAMAGEIAMPAGAVKEAFVDVDDIADVVVAALTEDRHSGQLYEVTGPSLLSFTEAAEVLSQAMGRPVRYQPITLEDFRAAMADLAGDFVADVFTLICRETLDGRNQALGDGVQRALARAPKDFARVCLEAARDGAWAEAA